MRHALSVARAWGLALLLIDAEQDAHAESCHAQAAFSRERSGLELGLASEAATFATSRFEGNYQALIASGAWQEAWGQLRMSLGAYRIVANGLSQHGLGDLSLGVQSVLFSQPEGLGLVGVRLAVQAPTGAVAKRLGMGHWMAMPGAWWQLGSSARYLLFDVGYGAALASQSGHHLHDTGPIVAPMNPSEVNISTVAGITVTEELRIRAVASLAAPVGLPGTRRGEGCLAVDPHASQLQATLEVCVPALGEAFDWKLRTGISWQF